MSQLPESHSIRQDCNQPIEQLLPQVYDELRALAASFMAHEQPGQTLDATALVHEAYLRLIRSKCQFNRPYFFAAASQAMRRILIDRARSRRSLKRGGYAVQMQLEDVALPDSDEELITLDENLRLLACSDPVAVQVVELHHFAGLTHEIVAETLGITIYQARLKWDYARAWLKTRMTKS